MSKLKRTDLSEREKQIVAFFEKYQKEHLGLPPSDREIMDVCGISSTSVMHYYLHQRLGRLGVLTEVAPKGSSRKWVLTCGEWSCNGKA